MHGVRRWSVRRARFLESTYQKFEAVMVRLHPVFERIGYERLERPVAMLERQVKGFLFDCQMCGQCVLSATGMACPMNCPKTLRNGPCGGVRPDGHCEVAPDMRCVWLEAVEGARRMRGGARIQDVQFCVDARLRNKSSWLRAAREKAAPSTPSPESVR